MCAVSSLGMKQNYRIRSIFGGDFNLAVWQFFVHPPNLNDPNIASLLLYVQQLQLFAKLK